MNHKPEGTGHTTTVHLVRHGEVDNPNNVLYGRAPGFLLSSAGHQMAHNVARLLASRDIVAVWSSPLERAIQTASHIASLHNLPVWQDRRLIEAASLLEGSTASLDKPIIRQPRVWRRLWNPWRPSWGEPYAEVHQRMWSAIADAAAEANTGEIVLVSHQLPIWIVRRRASGARAAHDPRRRECALASVTSLTLRDGHAVEIRYIDTHH